MDPGERTNAQAIAGSVSGIFQALGLTELTCQWEEGAPAAEERRSGSLI